MIEDQRTNRELGASGNIYEYSEFFWFSGVQECGKGVKRKWIELILVLKTIKPVLSNYVLHLDYFSSYEKVNGRLTPF